jgi:hypothetical protein
MPKSKKERGKWHKEISLSLKSETRSMNTNICSLSSIDMQTKKMLRKGIENENQTSLGSIKGNKKDKIDQATRNYDNLFLYWKIYRRLQ